MAHLLLSFTTTKTGRSNRSNVEGSVYLKLWLSTREDRGCSEEDDTMNAIEEHRKIYSVIADYYLNRYAALVRQILFVATFFHGIHD